MKSQFARVVISLLVLSHFSTSETPAKPDDLTIEKVGPIKPVGPIDPIAPFDPRKDREGGRKSADEVYLVCWTTNIKAKKPEFSCTEKYVESGALAYEFTNYKLMLYPPEKGGVAFAKTVIKADWDNSDSRKKIIKRIEKDVLPLVVEKKTGFKAEFFTPKWIDLKPVLSEKQQKAYKQGIPLKEDLEAKAEKGVSVAGNSYEYADKYSNSTWDFKEDKSIVVTQVPTGVGDTEKSSGKWKQAEDVISFSLLDAKGREFHYEGKVTDAKILFEKPFPFSVKKK